MTIFICYVVIFIAEAFILWLYCNDLFTPKYTVRRTLFCLSAFYTLLLFLSCLDNFSLNSVAFLIVNFIYIYMLYDTKWPTALFHAGITAVAMGLGELLSFSPVPSFIRNFYETRSNTSAFILFIISSKLIYFFIIFILSHLPISRINKKQQDVKGALVLIPIPFVTFFVTGTLYMIYYTTDISDLIVTLVTACSIQLLLLNLLIWFFFSYTQKQNQDFMDLQLSLQRENDTAEYYRMLSAQNETKNILIHNIRNHLYTISTLAEQNQTAEITDYISSLTKTASLQSSDTLLLCRNDILNAILCRYKEKCKEKEIRFKTDIRDGSIDFMAANDLTSLFCNLLDNAMEAAAGISNSFIELRISQQENTPYTILSVQNSCSEDPFDSQRKLPSRKKDQSRHGLGLKSIRRIVKGYGGDIEFYFEEGTRTFHVVARIKAVDPD